MRTAWVSGAHGANMVKTVLRVASSSTDGVLRFVDDQHGCPTFTADLARAVVRLGVDRRPGTFHVTNRGETTWFGFVQATMAAAGHRPGPGGADLDSRTGPAPPRTPAAELPAGQCRPATVRPAGHAAWEDALARLVDALPEGAAERARPVPGSIGRRPSLAGGLHRMLHDHGRPVADDRSDAAQDADRTGR